jgi:hypothetical protein
MKLNQNFNRNIIKDFKVYSKNNTYMLKLFCFLKRRNDLIVSRKTDLCIEGYPRSANTFACMLLYNINPNINIAHHTHSIANLKLALRYEIPAFVLIRFPIDAIVSYLIRREAFLGYNDQDIIYAMREYADFYNFVILNINELNIVKFEEIVDYTSKFLVSIKKNSDVDILHIEDLKVIKDKTKASIVKLSKRLKENSKSIAFPNGKRKKIKEEKKEKLIENYDDYFEELNMLYYNILRLRK